MSNTATKIISLNPLHNSLTTFLICGTSIKILRGLKHLRSIKNWATEWGDIVLGIQHAHTKLTIGRQKIWLESCCSEINFDYI